MPPSRADHIGSLLRPQVLRDAFKSHANGSMNDAAFKEIQDAAITDVVRMQEELGYTLITDGEFRRKSYWAHFVDAVDGLDVTTSRFSFHDEDGHDISFMAPHVVGKVRRTRSISGDEFEFLKKTTTKSPKITMPSPPTMHFWDKGEAIKAAGYSSTDEYFSDLANVYKEEIADLARRGLKYVQLDEVPLAMLCDEKLRQRLDANGENPDKVADAYVDLFNACIDSRPSSVTVGIHLCRGNFKGAWLSEGGYRSVSRKVFQNINADYYLCEFDTPRAGDFEPLRDLPDNKSVILGVVSSKTPTLERRQDVEQRIREAARFTSLDRLGVSPQCGFASTVAGNPVTYQDEVAKLRLVKEVADSVWG